MRTFSLTAAGRDGSTASDCMAGSSCAILRIGSRFTDLISSIARQAERRRADGGGGANTIW